MPEIALKSKNKFLTKPISNKFFNTILSCSNRLIDKSVGLIILLFLKFTKIYTVPVRDLFTVLPTTSLPPPEEVTSDVVSFASSETISLSISDVIPALMARFFSIFIYTSLLLISLKTSFMNFLSATSCNN